MEECLNFEYQTNKHKDMAVMPLRKRLRKNISRVIYVISLLAIFYIVSNIIEYNSNTSIPIHFPGEHLFLLYFSWAFLILGGIVLLNLRRNIYAKLFAIGSITIGLFWIALLIINS